MQIDQGGFLAGAMQQFLWGVLPFLIGGVVCLAAFWIFLKLKAGSDNF